VPFLRWVTGLILAALAGGCGASQGPASRPPPKPTSVAPPRRFDQSPRGHQWVPEAVVLEFEISDEGTHAPIEGASVEIINPYSLQIGPTQSTWTEGGIRLVAYHWWMYAQEEGLPPESYFLGNLWLQVTAPRYETVKVPLRKFVSERRAIDKVPWVKSSPLVVSLRKGERKPPRRIVGKYRGDQHLRLVLDIYGDGTFSVCNQHAHGCNPSGFGFAEIVDGKLKLTYAESQSYSEGHPEMTELLAKVDSAIKERSR
jgi:hypothetical protein